MTDKPILFSGPMINALLDGRKTQTRRTSGLSDVNNWPDAWALNNVGPLGYMAKKAVKNHFGATFESRKMEAGMLHVCPQKLPYSVGDRLWVRETFTETQHGKAVFRADARDETGQRWHSIAVGDPDREVKWTSPIFMPRKKSRLTLIVTDVRVQRVQDISEADAIAEGAECDTCIAMQQSACRRRGCPASKVAFQDLWNSIHGPEAWDRNDWVAAYTFTVHKQNIDKLGDAA